MVAERRAWSHVGLLVRSTPLDTCPCQLAGATAGNDVELDPELLTEDATRPLHPVGGALGAGRAGRGEAAGEVDVGTRVDVARQVDRGRAVVPADPRGAVAAGAPG